MNEGESMKAMHEIMQSQSLCVLATASPQGPHGSPHCSLMAYITGDDCRRLYMITPKNTRKFANLTANPTVSLLIDTRLAGNRPQAREAIRALTVNGKCRVIEQEHEQRSVRERFLEAHPHLADFVHSEDTAVFAVQISTLQLLDGIADASYESVS